MAVIKDFTIDKYNELCNNILNKYTVCNFYDYLTKYTDADLSGDSNSENGYDTANRNIAIIRHDIDRSINNALVMAELEYDLDISSSYYFRYPYTFKPDIIRKIESMGHEIGYHYETLSKAGGDYSLAIELFEKELSAFREICDVNTICMHGRPISAYDNRKIWDKYNFCDYDIIGEAYLSVDDVKYFSDTGRNWNGSHSLRDAIPGIKKEIPENLPNSTDDLISIINNSSYNNLYLTIHPERWAYNNINWGFSFLKDNLSVARKKVIRVIRNGA